MEHQAFILPTACIVFEATGYDKFFRQFLKDGAKTLVKESVLNHAFARQGCKTSMHGEEKSALLAAVLAEYDDFINRQQDAEEVKEEGLESFLMTNAGRRDRRARQKELLERYQADMAIIELVVPEIEAQVSSMLRHLFRSRLIDILDERSRWVKHDLLVNVRGFF